MTNPPKLPGVLHPRLLQQEIDRNREVEKKSVDEKTGTEVQQKVEVEPSQAPLESSTAVLQGTAAKAGVTPQELDRIAGSRLTELDQVTEDAFNAAMGVQAVALPTGDAKDSRQSARAPAAQVVAAVQAFVKKHGEKKLDELLREGRIIDVFRAAYRDAFGVEPVSATLQQLVSEYCDHLAAYSERPLMVTTTSSTGDVQQEPLRRFFASMLDELERCGLGEETAVLGGLNATGSSRALYAAAEGTPEVKRLGMMPGRGVVDEVSSVDAGTIVGVEPGDTAPLYWELAASSFLVGAGLDNRGRAHLEHHLREGGIAIVPGGFSANEVPPPASDNLIFLEGAASDPEAAGKRAAEMIAEKFYDRRRDSYAGSQEWLRLADSDREIIDVEKFGATYAAKARIRQLLGFAHDHLRAQIRDPRALRAELEKLAATLSEYTASIDPATENSVWTAQVRAAFAETGGSAAQLVKRGLLDVVLARWFTGSNHRETPSYFESHRGPLPALVGRLDVNGEYTFDTSRYVDFRLDPLTRAFLGRKDLPTDIFLGSPEELDAYYSTKGYEVVHTARRTHGVEFRVLRNEDGMRLVIQGVENEQRLIQLGAFLKKYGVPLKDMALGELDRVRDLDRTLLELEVASLDRSVAGVVINNTEQAKEALAESFGVPTAEIEKRMRTHNAGTFSFQSIDVLPAGSSDWKTLLFFEPALGASAADVVEATAKFSESPNIVLAGDAASFVASDEIGSLHQVSAIIDTDGTRHTWSELPGVEVISLPGAPEQVNYASSSLMEQSRRWAEKATAAGAGNTDQETAHIFAAVKRLSDEGKRVHIQPTLAIRDVMGRGDVVSGVKPERELRELRRGVRSFLERLGLQKARAGDGRPLTRNARPGLAAGTGSVDISSIEIQVSDLSTMGNSQVAGTVEQFKGQKRSLVIDASTSFAANRDKLADLLGRLDANKFWVVLDVNDGHHGEVNDLARSLGYETVVVGTADDLVQRRLQSSPNFYLKQKTRAEVESVQAELVRDASGDIDANFSRSYRVCTGGASGDAIGLSELDTPGLERVVSEVSAETQRNLKRIQEAIAWRRERLGLEPARYYSTNAELDRFMGGRKPHIWAGFSKLSAADIAEGDRAEAERLIELEALVTDPAQTVDVTGITAYGFEKSVQDVKSRPERTFDVLGVLTENTEVSAIDLMKAFDALPPDWQASLLEVAPEKMRDYLQPLAKGGDPKADQVAILKRALGADASRQKSALQRLKAVGPPSLADLFGEIYAGHTGWEPSDRIRHILPVSVSWTGQSRQLLMRVARRYDGQVTNAGGGGVLKELIGMQFAMGVRTHLWAGLEMSEQARAAGKHSAGASVDMAEEHPAHAFRTVEEYFARRGLLRRYQRLLDQAKASGFDLASAESVRAFARTLV